jgi:hypothetical protein
MLMGHSEEQEEEEEDDQEQQQQEETLERSSSPDFPSPVVEYLEESEMTGFMDDESDTASDTELDMH